MKTIMVYGLTTVDNPYDYFDQPDEWEGYENSTGMRATSMLGRFSYTSRDLSYAENIKEIERAIDEIIKYDYAKEFKKVGKEIALEEK